MSEDKDIQRLISQSILRIRMHSPFFASLMMFAKFVPNASIPRSATDGKTIWFNPDLARKVSGRQLDGILCHEVLHAALSHTRRRGSREAQRWNIAADVVVNGVLAKQNSFDLLPDSIRCETIEHLSVEEIYELVKLNGLEGHCPSCLQGHGDLELERYWDRAVRQAEAAARMQGKLPAGMDRLLSFIDRSQIDWKAALWRFLVRTPADYEGFDRRFFHQKQYLEMLEGETVRAHICIDTSGSIGTAELEMFMGEVVGILGAYPHIKASLYYADAGLYGPFDVHEQVARPTPKGGGGTSFEPFFAHVSEKFDDDGVCIYLTDGYGSFPSERPKMDTLWVVTAGGLASDQFPFGETVRLIRG